MAVTSAACGLPPTMTFSLVPAAASAGGPRKVAGVAALLGDGEAQVGLDGADGLIDVVTIKRQAGLQAQAVAGAEADGPHPLVGAQQVPDPLGLSGRDRDLIAVLAGIARA